MTEALEAATMPIGAEAADGSTHEVTMAAPIIDPRAFDVGPNCPQDDLQRRLDEARARLLLSPPKPGPPLRWRI